jgi:hypothetical protein
VAEVTFLIVDRKERGREKERDRETERERERKNACAPGLSLFPHFILSRVSAYAMVLPTCFSIQSRSRSTYKDSQNFVFVS